MDYLDQKRRNLIAEWLSDLPNRARAKVDQRLERIAGLKREEWPIIWTKPLRGVRGIFEIRLESGNVQYRPLFCFGPKQRQLTLLIGAIEVGGTFVPERSPQIAEERRAEIENDPSRVIDHGLLEDKTTR